MAVDYPTKLDTESENDMPSDNSKITVETKKTWKKPTIVDLEDLQKGDGCCTSSCLKMGKGVGV